MTGTNDYSLWEALLAAKVAGIEPPPIDPNEPAVGFYRSRRKGQPYVPVAIWMDDGELCCQMNGEDIAAQKVIDSWPFISKNPVSHPQYEFYMANGRWEDADEVVHQQVTERGIGDNNPPDEFALLEEQIASASAGTSAYKTIESDEQQARAQSLRSRLLELSGQADKCKDAEAGPPYKIYKAALAKWKPLVDGAKAGADAIRSAMSNFETAKADKIRKEQAEAERLLRVAQEAARVEAEKAQAAGKPVAIVHVPPPPVAPPPPPLNVKGAYGRAAAVKPIKVVSRVSDIDALYAYFKTYGEVEECLLELARKFVKRYPDSAPPPGVELTDKMDIR